MLRPAAILMLLPLALPASAEWVPVLEADAGAMVGDPADWGAYRQAEVTPMQTPGGAPAVHVANADPRFGGVRITISPRGGLGNRMCVELEARVLSGPPVTVYVGPNSWNQVGAVLASPEWQPVAFEIGLLSDAPTVLHIAQPGPEGAFELGGLRVFVQAPDDPQVPADLGPIDLAVIGHVGGEVTPLFVSTGQPAPTLTSPEPRDLASPSWRFSAPAPAGEAAPSLRQGLGALPAGTRLRIEALCRVVEGGPGRLSLLWNGAEGASAEVAGSEWQDVTVEALLPVDAMPQWGIGAEGACELLLADPRVLVTLPDPAGPGVVALPDERRPITLAMGDAKSIFITPPWPFMRRILAHLEYNSRWNYRFPDEHEVELSEAGDRLTLRWHFADDPVGYVVAMTADRPDSVLVEARLTNEGDEPTAIFVPGFCLQLMGEWSPRSFAYTIIPRDGEPLRLDIATQFAPTDEPWPRFGWVRADYANSEAHEARQEAGDAYEPDDRRVREVGDFPLLARRVPGRDAWVAWVWPDVTGYFGNAAAPCMHMDPVLAPAAPGESAGVFGRMIFFEGTWAQLREHAKTVRAELAAISDLRPAARKE